MTDTRAAHVFFAATSLIVTFGLVLQPWLSVSAGSDDGSFPTVLLNVTIVAVLFLAISFCALALDRRLPGARVG